MNDNHALLEALSAAVYTTDAAGRITFYNSAAAELWGRKPELGSLWCGSWKIYTPDGALLPHDQCPMAVALKEQRIVRGVSALAERPDGTRVPFLPFPTPLFDTNGQLVGAINLLVDLTEAHLLEEDRARLAAIVDSSDDAIVGKGLDGVVTSWNAGAQNIFGYRPEEMIGRSITTIIPPELHAEEVEILARLARGERIQHYETVRVSKNGRRVDISLTVSPIRDIRGKIIGASKVARDITERKRAQAMEQLLVRELNHRVKNMLATVEAMALQTLRRSANAAAFASSFSGRIRALANANSLLTSERFQRASLLELIREQLILGDRDQSRIACSGPDLNLGAQTTLQLGLVLHELGTNARKYGALSAEGGNLSISWGVEGVEQQVLVMTWRESGGPTVVAPRKSGFGTTLIEQSLRAQGGEVALRFSETGLECSMRVPLTEQGEILALAPQAAAAPRSEPLAKTPPSAAPLPLATKRILIVEDEPLIAMVACDYVADAGAEIVGPAATTTAALELIRANRIDAALLDANLGGSSSADIALALTRKAIPFAFVTGYDRDSLPAPFREALLVEKPFSAAQLCSAVERLLQHQAGDSLAKRRRRNE